jgi:hypothetical protein
VEVQLAKLPARELDSKIRKLVLQAVVGQTTSRDKRHLEALLGKNCSAALGALVEDDLVQSDLNLSLTKDRVADAMPSCLHNLTDSLSAANRSVVEHFVARQAVFASHLSQVAHNAAPEALADPSMKHMLKSILVNDVRGFGSGSSKELLSEMPVRVLTTLLANVKLNQSVGLAAMEKFAKMKQLLHGLESGDQKAVLKIVEEASARNDEEKEDEETGMISRLNRLESNGTELYSLDLGSRVKTVLANALQQAGVLLNANDPSVRRLSARALAKMLAGAHVDTSVLHSPELSAALQLSGRIASGDVDAGVQLVEQQQLAKNISLDRQRAQLGAEEARLSLVSVKPSEMNDAVKAQLLKVMVSAGVIQDADGSVWQNISAAHLAKMISSANVDQSLLTPDAAQVLKLAQRLAEGDATAATAMLALQTLENGRVSAIHHREVAAARASLKRASLGNNRFNKELKSLVLRALVATGAIESAAIPSMLQHISVEHAARLLARSSRKVDSVTDPVLQETIRNARAIASGELDAARNLVADARIAARGSEMLPDAEKKLLETRFNHVSLKDSSFNHKVRRSLLKMLQKSGLIVDASAAQWQQIDAQSAAKMLASTAQLKPEQLNLVKRIANGDAAAAKLVLAQSNFEDQLQRAEQSLDGVSLQDNGFRHNLKGVLLQALRRSGETGARLAARNMNSTVEGVAAVLQDTADASSTKSLIVGQAAVLSSRIAKADLSAAKQLVARQAVLQKLRANAQVHSYRRELHRMRTRP